MFQLDHLTTQLFDYIYYYNRGYYACDYQFIMTLSPLPENRNRW